MEAKSLTKHKSNAMV